MSWFVPQHVPLPINFTGFDPESTLPVEGFDSYTRHLPHWRFPGACYICTFRTRDSLPLEIMEQFKAEEQRWQKRLDAATQKGVLPSEIRDAWHAFQRKQVRKLDLLLDTGRGECLLRHPEHRTILAEAFHHFEGARVEMLAYVIMPNHAHVLCRPLPGHVLEMLTASWKRHSSQRIHRLLGRTGPLWQNETWDRMIRDEAHYTRAVRYIAQNPAKAQLQQNEATVWLHPSMLGDL
jgi:putative transposase